ncbi:MAG: ABC transporter substrate-binding protein, partial [Bacillota bacterium]
DRESIVKNILGGYGIPIGTPLPQGFFGYEEGFKATPYDPEKAKTLLAEAGYPNGFEIDMATPSGRYLMDKEVSEAIVGQLAKVGIKAKLRTEEWGVYAQKIFSKEQAPLFLVGWGNSTFDADGNYYSLLKSGERMAYYNSAKLDDLLVRARATMDQKARASLYHEANQHFVDEQPLIVLYQNKDVYATSSRLAWTPRSDELIMLHQADVQVK